MIAYNGGMLSEAKHALFRRCSAFQIIWAALHTASLAHHDGEGVENKLNGEHRHHRVEVGRRTPCTNQHIQTKLAERERGEPDR